MERNVSYQARAQLEKANTGKTNVEGFLDMLGCRKVNNEGELQAANLDGLVENARTIENLLRRAHEIHRQHGGILGYDLEDWLQAEKELAEEHLTTFRRGGAVPIEVEISH